MLRRLLAVCSLAPIALLVLVSIGSVVLTVQRMGAGTPAYRIGYWIGLGLAYSSSGLLLFLWARWAIRTLKK